MILLTPELREHLLTNGRRLDHVPAVKFFNPLGIGTWLATELDENGDTLYARRPRRSRARIVQPCRDGSPGASLGMGIERDIPFADDYPLSVYAQATRTAGRIVIDKRSPRAATAALQRDG